MRCTNPVNLSGVELPCGKCLACKKNYSSEWTARIVHELDYYPQSCFLTLTYDDDHLPKDGSVSKDELQRFFKRIRKNYKGIKFKYYACGEYGETTKRPHYHAVILGIPQNWEGFKICDPNNPNIVRCDEWTNGFVHVGTISADSIRYVTDYVLKSMFGQLAEQVYGQKEPPFKLSSQGFGKRYCVKNREALLEQGSMTLRSASVALPRYYRKEIGIKESVYSKVLEERAMLKALARYVSLIIQHGTICPDCLKMIQEKLNKQRAKNIEAKNKLRERIGA